jgi:thioesterase domain-containing protein
VLAYEMAQQLHDQGEDVALVAMFDSFCPGYPKLRPLVGRATYNLLHRLRLFAFVVATLLHLPRGQRLAYFRRKTARLRFTAASLLRRVARRPTPLARTQRALDLAHDRYNPKPYAGSVTLFRAQRLPWGIEPARTMGWGNLVERLEVRKLPVYFTTGIAEPEVSRLAHALQERIDERIAELADGRVGPASSSPAGYRRQVQVQSVPDAETAPT